MTVVVTTDGRYDRMPDGSVWGLGSGYGFWTRYLEVFENVRILARVRDSDAPVAGARRADGPGVLFAGVPYYIGPWQYFKRSRAVRRAALDAVGPADAVIFRVGSLIATCLDPTFRAEGRPYAVEVVGDPWDVFAPGVVRHVLRPFLRRWFAHVQRRQCTNACGAAYVTSRSLQERYPCGLCDPSLASVEPEGVAGEPRAVGVTQYSDVELAAADFAEEVPERPSGGPLKLVTVGSLEQLYKGVDILIRAVGLCDAGGLETELRIVGDGRYRTQLQELAQSLNVARLVRFLGVLPAGPDVRRELDRADVFVLASRTEGLPRALIEAMARGLPCIASNVGGIPELLAADDMVPPGDPKALADTLVAVGESPERRAAMGCRNLSRAREYRSEILQERRRRFYEHVRATTDRWASARQYAT